MFDGSMICGLLAFGVGPQEMIVIAIVAVLLFGQRLPEVGRSLGKGLSEFKKGMRGIEEEFQFNSNSSSSRPARPTPRVHDIDDRDEATAPKFEPPTTAPQVEPPATAQFGPSTRNESDVG